VSVVVQAAGCDFRSAVLCKRCLGAQMSTLVTGSLDMGARLTTFDHSLPTRLRLSASVTLSFGREKEALVPPIEPLIQIFFHIFSLRPQSPKAV
jgi:hypothetical protein